MTFLEKNFSRNIMDFVCAFMYHLLEVKSMSEFIRDLLERSTDAKGDGWYRA